MSDLEALYQRLRQKITAGLTGDALIDLEYYSEGLKKQIADLRSRNTILQSSLDSATNAAGKRFRDNQDYVPYGDDDYRD